MGIAMSQTIGGQKENVEQYYIMTQTIQHIAHTMENKAHYLAFNLDGVMPSYNKHTKCFNH